jgi:aspartate/methionine/tyrosine aminotransferase
LKLEISKSAREMKPFIVMDVMERSGEMESEGKSVVHLEVGEPDFKTPRVIEDAAVEAIRKGATGYTHSLGLPELRAEIAKHYFRKYGARIDPECVLVTSGTSPALLLAFSAVLEPGDEVILSNPYYPCYPNFIRYLKAKPVLVKVREEEGFQYDPDEIKKKITRRTRIIVLNSPANPTGNMTSDERMKAIAGLGVTVLSDEIYHGLVYEGRERSMLEFTRNTVVLNGFSKAYAMTGWRLGYAIFPREMRRPLQKLQQNFFISANSFVQWAGLAALRKASGDVMRMRGIYDQRRKFIVPALRDLGFGITVAPTGAFYVFANAKKYTRDSYKFAFDILKRARVAVSPGIDFGSNGEGYLRFSYANSLEEIKKGMKNLGRYLKDRGLR